VQLARKRYRGCNQVHLTELLAENEGIVLGRMTVRRILAEVRIASPKTRRPPRHRRRRERATAVGTLLQKDGSPHDWLEGRGPRMCLQAAVDDASGEVHGAVFRPQEDAAGYLMVLERVTKHYGIPIAVYHDRHTIFGSTKASVSRRNCRAAGGSRATWDERLKTWAFGRYGHKHPRQRVVSKDCSELCRTVW
jgi:hypothetical protein